MRYTENDISAEERLHLNALRKKQADAQARYLSIPGNDEMGVGDDPVCHAAWLAVMEERERLGVTYPETVEIMFPRQIVNRYGFHGLVVPTSDVLRMLAYNCEEKDPARAKMYREIAETFYDEEDDVEDEEDGIEVLERLVLAYENRKACSDGKNLCDAGSVGS